MSRMPKEWTKAFKGIHDPLMLAGSALAQKSERRRSGRPEHLPKKNRKTGRLVGAELCETCGGRVKSRRGSLQVHSH